MCDLVPCASLCAVRYFGEDYDQWCIKSSSFLTPVWGVDYYYDIDYYYVGLSLGIARESPT